MKFQVTGRDNGKHVVRFEDGSVEHCTDERLGELEGKPAKSKGAAESKEVESLRKDLEAARKDVEEWKKRAEDAEGKLAKLEQANADAAKTDANPVSPKDPAVKQEGGK